MRLATVKVNGREIAGIVTETGIVLVETLNEKTGSAWSCELFDIICKGEVPKLNDWYKKGGREILASCEAIPYDKVVYGPLYRNPQRIFGIGLNYADHAKDLGERTPTGIPGSFFKPATTIIGHGDNVELPLISNEVDGEGELAVIIGKECEDIEAKDWLDYVAGFTVSVDMTSLDILRQNPRYLTIAKSFKTFFCFGPQLVTPDEVEDVLKLKVQTIHNGKVHAENLVSNMTFPPDFLVSFISKVMKWLPGDVLSTGTPLAAHLHHGDTIAGHVSGFETLTCNVIDKKVVKKV